MNKIEALQGFFLSHATQSSLLIVVLNLFLSGILAYMLRLFYIKYGNCLSNRRAFSNNFIMMAMTTMLIITLIKTSLALSLGLIGALSIVRFRAAIKDPEELSYLFIAIAIGLGFGANKQLITIIAFVSILAFVRVKGFLSGGKDEWDQDMYLSVKTSFDSQLSLDMMNEILTENCHRYSVKRMDKTDDLIDVFFLVEFNTRESLNKIESNLRNIDKTIKVSFLDYGSGRTF
jgi:uncharacterized membrane protein YhiD involved in acid resistance